MNNPFANRYPSIFIGMEVNSPTVNLPTMPRKNKISQNDRLPKNHLHQHHIVYSVDSVGDLFSRKAVMTGKTSVVWETDNDT